MKIVQINATCQKGSTGKICAAVSELLSAEGVENYVLYSNGQSNLSAGIKYADDRSIRINSARSKLAGNYGFNSKKMTERLIEELEKRDPDIIHLHNIHSHNCNIEMLFDHFKKSNAKLIWTFHDCWAFTGYCMYFDAAGCTKWKTGCSDCPQRKKYSLLFDRSEELYKKKKNLFSGLDLTIVTPSRWLARLVGESHLSSYPVKVINNGIDLDAFRYMPGDFREKYGIENDKKILLGVAYRWEKRKGIDAFYKLAHELRDECRVVLVGGKGDREKGIPDNVISIERTSSREELAKIYSAADLLVNPTAEDNFPTVNIEALACGTPVVTYDTGGSAEIPDDTCGAVVPRNDAEALVETVRGLCRDYPFTRDKCRKRAEEFDQNVKFGEYVKLYREICNE